ncbi:hypothetical protein [Micromonospora sp. NPDC050200]|uniref:hypothetical protein n=1 Tax=Micromonospora sp. NPDC050200 TaxID=3155664 RepID=UPI0033C4EAB6
MNRADWPSSSRARRNVTSVAHSAPLDLHGLIFVHAAAVTCCPTATAAFTWCALTGCASEVARTLHLTGAVEVPGLTLLWPGDAAVPRTSEAAA